MGKFNAFFTRLLGMASAITLGQQVAIAQVIPSTTDTSQQRAEQLTLSYLASHRQEFGLSSLDDVSIKSRIVDRLSMTHMRLQQRMQGIPVFGGEAIMHLAKDGQVAGVTNHFIQKLRPDFKRSRITSAKAIETAIAQYGCSACLSSRPESDLWILRQDNQDHLVFRVQLRREDSSPETALPVYFVDAHTNKIIWSYNNLQTGTGVSLYSGVVPLTTLRLGTSFYLEDVTRQIGTFNAQNSTLSSRIIRFTDVDDLWNSTVQRAAVDAQYGAVKTLEYYLNVHGRRGINGNGGPTATTSANGVTRLLTSVVHYGQRYNNAFWNGSYMTYGDGDGTTFSPLVSLDVAGHEMTHGVTQFTANLIYSNESGALNESMSDVFGALIERYAKGESSNTWKIGEEIYTPATTGDALRFMSNPHAASNRGFTADDDPDHYLERYQGTADNGGVHVNSGIPNFVFYLLAQGGTHHRGGSITGIGADKAARIWYLALTGYMTSSTNFKQARQATINAANALYGVNSVESTTVASAWSLCGVN